MIEVRGLTKRYGPTVAVDGLALEVKPGTVTGFLGPNGSGKSTTMRMIIGLDEPDAGQAWIGGRRLRGAGWALRRVRCRLGLPRPGLAAAPGRLAARSQVLPPGPVGPYPPGRAGRQQRPARPSGGRGAGD